MKRIWILVLALLCLTSALAETGRVQNPDGILSASEVSALESRMEELCAEFDIDLILAISDSVSGDAEEVLYALHSQLRGANAHPDWGAFVVCLRNRTYSFQAYGRLDDALYRYGGDRIQDQVVPLLSSGRYAESFEAWLNCIDTACTPRSPFAVAGEYLVFIVILAALVALIVVFVLKRQLLTAKFQSSADSFVREGSLQLIEHSDHFLYQTVTVRMIEQNHNHSHGGGGGGGGGSRSGRSGSF